MVGGWGFDGQDVQARASDPALAEGGGKRGLVDQRAAAGVDQDAAGLHGREGFGVDDVLGAVAEGTVQGDDIGFLQQCRQRVTVLRAGRRLGLGLGIGPVVDDAHVEAPCSPRDGLADRPESDNTQRGAVYPPPERGGTRCPVSAAQRPFAFAQAAAGGQQQGHGEIRRVLGDDRRIADLDARGCRRRQIDVVGTHAEIGNQAQGVGKGSDQLRRDRVHGGAHPDRRAIEAG